MAKSTAKIRAIVAAVRFRNKTRPEPRAGRGLGFGGAMVDPDGARWPPGVTCFNRGLINPMGAAGTSCGRDDGLGDVGFFGSPES